MNIRKYISLLLLLAVGLTARGQFNPSNPPEPNAKYLVTLKCDPAEAGSVSGGGKYDVGKSVTVKATASSVAWRFVNWTNEAGDEVSTSSSYTFTISDNTTLTAHFEPVPTSIVTLSYNPPSAGANFSLDGSGTYAVGTDVSISAYNYSDWTFQNWTRRSDDAVMSTNRSFTYTTTADDVELVANYKFTPGSNPTEPSETKPKHKVYFTSNPAGAGFSESPGFSVEEGKSYSFYVYTMTNYDFVNWTLDGVEVGTNRTYTAKMGTEDVHLVANFKFNPSAPSDPNADTQQRYTLYGQAADLYQGETTLYPIYLENTGAVKELTFSIALPAAITVDTEAIQTTSRTSAYSITAGIESGVLTVNLTGGTQISDVNGAILQLPLSTTAAAEDEAYTLSFSNITLTLTDESTPTCTSRPGTVNVTTLEEGDLLAQFSVDRYMNRAQFTNLSTDNCRTFEWDFGDGETSTEKNPLHVYANPGTYTVTLVARGLKKSSEAQQNIIINQPSTWTAEGDYTLNNEGTGVRNFVSVEEMLSLLGQCTPTNAINITVNNNQTYAFSAQSDEAVGLLTNLSSKLLKANVLLTLVGIDAENDSQLNILTDADATQAQAAMLFVKTIYTDHVAISLNGAGVDGSVLRGIVDQEVCAESDTQALNLTALSSDSSITVEWTATASDASITDYLANGTGNLPTQQIKNSSMTPQTVAYDIQYKQNGTLIHQTSHTITVRPLISQKSISYNITDGEALWYGNNTLRWTDLSKIATGYTLNLSWVNDDLSEDNKQITLGKTAYTYTLDCTPGATYTWTVTAHGACDDLVGPTQTFTVRHQADLTVSIDMPETAKALNTLTLKATINNAGKGITRSTSWTDAIYSSATNDFNAATRLTTITHSGALAAGDSYEITYDVSMPEATQSEIFFFVKTDLNDSEKESDETNNVAVHRVGVTSSYADEADYNILKTVYQTYGGTAWTSQWDITSNEISTDAWPGVTFDNNGHVSAIDLSGFGLTAFPEELFTLPAITSINLSGNSLSGTLADLFDSIGEQSTLTTLNLSNNLLKGNLYDATSKLPALETLVANNNKIRDFYPLAPATLKKTNVANQDLTEETPLNYSDIFNKNGRMGETVIPSVLFLTNYAEYYYYTQLYVTDRPDDSYTWGMQFQYNRSSSTDNYMPYYYDYPQPRGWYYGTSGETVHVFSSRSFEGTHFLVNLDFEQGDVDFDAAVKVNDMQKTLNYALSSTYYHPSDPLNFTAADLVKDGVLTVQDVVANINLLLSKDITPSLAKRRGPSTKEDEVIELAGEEAEASQSALTAGEAEGALFIREGQLVLKSTVPVAALDLTFTNGSIEWKPVMSWFTKEERTFSNGRHVVFYSLFGDEIPAGETVLATLTADLADADLSDIDGNLLRVTIGEGETTGISTVDEPASKQARESIYTLDGRKVNAINQKGIYIQNGKKFVRK